MKRAPAISKQKYPSFKEIQVLNIERILLDFAKIEYNNNTEDVK